MGEFLDYPLDSLRYKYFVRESAEHGAKLEIRTFQWLVERYTKPGDTILDPMAGVGTVHWAATLGRNTIAIELGERFREIHKMNIEALRKNPGFNGNEPVLYEGDCRRFLPLDKPVDAVIFSPPYGSVEKGASSKSFEERPQYFGYSDEDANIGNISSYPFYMEAMKVVYWLCYQSLKPGAPLILITKDYVSKGDRIYVSKDNAKVAYDVGYVLEDWHLRSSPMKGHTSGQHAKRRQAKGTDRPELNIDVEDILVLRKPGG